MLHYAENTQQEISNNINCGIYFISVRLFTEFGFPSQSDEINDSEHGFSGGDGLTNNADNVSLSQHSTAYGRGDKGENSPREF